MKSIVAFCAVLMFALATQTGFAQSDSSGETRTQRIDRSRAQISEAIKKREGMLQTRAGQQAFSSADRTSASLVTEFHKDFTPHQLFRGDSVTIDNVHVTWKFTAMHKATTDSLGRLEFRREGKQGAESESASGFHLELSGESFFARKEPGMISLKQQQFYLAPIAFQITVDQDRGNIKNLVLNSNLQPDRIKLTSLEYGTVGIYVSRVSPILIQQEWWSISNEPKKYPDGKQIYQLQIHDTDGNLKAEIPLTEGAFLEIGRYRIEVEIYDLKTETARLAVTIKADPSIKGRWASVQFPFQSNWPLEKVFGELAKTAGFKIDWEAAPGHPESIDYIKNYVEPSNSSKSSSYENLVDNIITYVAADKPIRCEWISDTELKVSPKEYDKVLAEQAKKAALDKENQEAVKKFDAECRLETKIYPLRSISIATAKSIVEPELHAYKLSKDYDGKYIVVHERHPWAMVENRSARETVVADDKSNSLILTAFPKTHEKVVALLQKIDQSLAPAAAAEVPNRFQIEAILLRGDKAGTSTLPSYLSAKDLESLGVKSVTQTGRAIVSLAAEKGELGKAKATLGDGYGVELAFQDMRKPYLIVRGSLIGTAGASAGEGLIDLEVGQEVEIHGTSFRLEEVIENRQNPKADSAKLKVDARGIPHEELTISEMQPQVVSHFKVEITAESIEPEPGPHNGKISLRVRPTTPAGREPNGLNQTLLENTVFLEPGKPALLGLTNMREALILVLRWQK